MTKRKVYSSREKNDEKKERRYQYDLNNLSDTSPLTLILALYSIGLTVFLAAFVSPPKIVNEWFYKLGGITYTVAVALLVVWLGAWYIKQQEFRRKYL